MRFRIRWNVANVKYLEHEVCIPFRRPSKSHFVKIILIDRLSQRRSLCKVLDRLTDWLTRHSWSGKNGRFRSRNWTRRMSRGRSLRSIRDWMYLAEQNQVNTAMSDRMSYLFCRAIYPFMHASNLSNVSDVKRNTLYYWHQTNSEQYLNWSLKIRNMGTTRNTIFARTHEAGATNYFVQ